MFEVKTLPQSFIKTFVYDYAEEVDNKVNDYAEKHNLEIISISIHYLKFTGVFYATVLFERGIE